MKIAKFGGTSMGSAEAMRNAASILEADKSSRLVVVSATSGTTNQLLNFVNAEFNNENDLANQIKIEIRNRHEALAKELNIEVKAILGLFKELDDLQKTIHDARNSGMTSHPRLLDHALSLGERFSSEIFSSLLNARSSKASCFDARRVIRTDNKYGKADPDIPAISSLARQILKPELERFDVLVTQGFIGSAGAGNTTTLGRGGSDYSAALFAEALRAEAILIWTDVAGVYTIDPNLVPKAQPIAELSFAEAAELANFGAKVLHPATLIPASRAGIPVFVGSTFNPNGKGTWIRMECTESPLARAIAIRKNQTLITVTSLRMLNAHGFLARIFQTLAEHHLSIDLVTTSEISVALTVDGNNLGSAGGSILDNQAMLDELRSFSDVSVEENLSLIALIGNRLTQSPGVATQAFSAIEPANVRLYCHGASQHNLCLVVNSDEAKNIAQKLHDTFLGGQ